MTDLLLAQSLGEYGAQGSAASVIQRLSDSVNSIVSGATPTTWMVVGAIVVAVLWFWGRSGSR